MPSRRRRWPRPRSRGEDPLGERGRKAAADLGGSVVRQRSSPGAVDGCHRPCCGSSGARVPLPGVSPIWATAIAFSPIVPGPKRTQPRWMWCRPGCQRWVPPRPRHRAPPLAPSAWRGGGPGGSRRPGSGCGRGGLRNRRPRQPSGADAGPRHRTPGQCT
jgi:hypothetical protein